MECLCGKMVESTRAHIKMIRKKAKVCSHGQMVESIMDNGHMANRMERESIPHQRVKPSMEFGEKERE